MGLLFLERISHPASLSCTSFPESLQLGFSPCGHYHRPLGVFLLSFLLPSTAAPSKPSAFHLLTPPESSLSPSPLPQCALSLCHLLPAQPLLPPSLSACAFRSTHRAIAGVSSLFSSLQWCIHFIRRHIPSIQNSKHKTGKWEGPPPTLCPSAPPESCPSSQHGMSSRAGTPHIWGSVGGELRRSVD